MEVNNTIKKKIFIKRHRSKYKTPKRLSSYVQTPSTSENDSVTDYEDEEYTSDFCVHIVPRNLLASY